MAGTKAQSPWNLVAEQHGVVSRGQLLDLGFARAAIEHRIKTARLFPVARGIYAVGRPQLSHHGWLMAAVLAAGPGARVSHASAAFLLGLVPFWPSGPIHVTGHCDRGRRRAGLTLHRRHLTELDCADRAGIPVTSPGRTIVDTAPSLSTEQLERRINLADSLDLIDPDALAAELPRMRGQRGVRPVRDLIEQYTFRLTDSELEQRFLRVAASLQLGRPVTRHRLNGFRTDFAWPRLGLVIEADSLRYHRTPGQQQRDHLRDQAHLARGMVPLRFTHHQITYGAAYVRRTIIEVVDTHDLRGRFSRP